MDTSSRQVIAQTNDHIAVLEAAHLCSQPVTFNGARWIVTKAETTHSGTMPTGRVYYGIPLRALRKLPLTA